MWELRQDGDKWLLVKAGATLSTHDNHGEAYTALAKALGAANTLAAEETGLLPESWSGPIARSVLTDDGRDFRETKWSARNADTARMPLMWQTVNDIGHYNSVLAGFVETIETDTEPHASGRFFDSEAGRSFRDVLVGAGRWGVSVDPGDVVAEENCLEWDEEIGWCTEFEIKFLEYQIIGVTGTPFPAMADAYIELSSGSTSTADDNADEGGDTADTSGDGATADDAKAAVTASGVPHLLRTPHQWFDRGEELADAREPVPFTLDLDHDSPTFGRFYGHLSDKTTCHSGLSTANTCVLVPQDIALSRIHYGVRMTDKGTLATGPMIFGTEHLMDLYAPVQDAIDHYAHTGYAWGDARFGVDNLGVWCAGAIRSAFADDDDSLQIIAASNQSGDWREINNELKLIACLTVNVPAAAPSHRIKALVASGKPVPATMVQRTRVHEGRIVAALGLGMVKKPCAECTKRRNSVQAGGQMPAVVLAALNDVRTTQAEQARVLAKILRRTTPGYAEREAARRNELRERVTAARP